MQLSLQLTLVKLPNICLLEAHPVQRLLSTLLSVCLRHSIDSTRMTSSRTLPGSSASALRCFGRGGIRGKLQEDIMPCKPPRPQWHCPPRDSTGLALIQPLDKCSQGVCAYVACCLQGNWCPQLPAERQMTQLPVGFKFFLL
jgi:hypothetical protein